MSDHDGPLVVFKSVADMWAKEHDGRKPNTIRVVDTPDHTYDRVVDAFENGYPTSIGVVLNTDTSRIFFRRLTDISEVGQLLGKRVVCFSWRHEDGDGTYRDPEGESDE